jgi:LPS sulfotransferase NodH
LQDLRKFTPNGIFGLKIYHLATLLEKLCAWWACLGGVCGRVGSETGKAIVVFLKKNRAKCVSAATMALT